MPNIKKNQQKTKLDYENLIKHLRNFPWQWLDDFLSIFPNNSQKSGFPANTNSTAVTSPFVYLFALLIFVVIVLLVL